MGHWEIRVVFLRLVKLWVIAGLVFTKGCSQSSKGLLLFGGGCFGPHMVLV